MANTTNAYSIVETGRLAARSRYMDKLDKITADIPQLADLNRQISNTGAEMTYASITKNNETLENCKQLMGRLTAQRKSLLEQHGYSEKDLEPIYYCNICKDTGVINGRTCKCVTQAVITTKQENLTKFSPVPDVSFESFDINYYPKKARQLANNTVVVPYEHMKNVLKYCKDYSDYFNKDINSILMLGASGLGKTHLACSIAKAVMDKGFVVMYVSAQSFFNKVEQAKYTDEDVLSDILDCDLFILDDLGAEHMTNYSLSVLYNIVNTRVLERKPCIYTTNYPSRTVLSQKYGEKISSRIIGSSQALYFFGDDIRIQKRTAGEQI